MAKAKSVDVLPDVMSSGRNFIAHIPPDINSDAIVAEIKQNGIFVDVQAEKIKGPTGLAAGTVVTGRGPRVSEWLNVMTVRRPLRSHKR
jgi:hypothetical protein